MVYENYLSPGTSIRLLAEEDRNNSAAVDFPDAPRTKIVCTIGPASDSEEKLSQLVSCPSFIWRLIVERSR